MLASHGCLFEVAADGDEAVELVHARLRSLTSASSSSSSIVSTEAPSISSLSASPSSDSSSLSLAASSSASVSSASAKHRLFDAVFMDLRESAFHHSMLVDHSFCFPP